MTARVSGWRTARVRVLRCAADGTRAVIVDSLGVPLDMGRLVRWATPAQKMAMAVRDGGCTWWGCTLPPQWTDAHHIHEWNHDGPTDVASMACLCRHHHTVIHRPGWQMFADDDSWFWFQAPNGKTFWGQRHGTQRPGPAPPPT